jgi:hypothetical protein
MAETIRNFRENLAEPWTVVAGMTPYLESAKREHVLSKAIYFPYGAIELEPAFPSTNVLLKPARDVFLKRAEYSQLDSVFGNNQIMLLQFPLTHYFFSTAWDNSYVDTGETQNLQAVAEQIYPEHSQLLVEAFLALRESDPEKIVVVRSQLDSLVQQKALGRPGVLSHHLFPDRSIIARDLVTQLDIRLARQLLLKALHGKPSPEECARLMTDYFHKLLAWNEETGWEKVIDTGIWTQPIYEQGKDFTEAISHLKEILGQGEPYTSYEQVNSFFQGIQTELLKLHRQNSVMIGCIEPFKLAVVQMQ